MSRRELAVLLGVCFVWGLHIVVIKLSVGEAPPIFYAAVRMTLVAVVMAYFLRWRPGAMARVIAAGMCLGGFNYALLFSGLRHATASATAIAWELYTPFVTILSVLVLKEKVGWRRSLGVGLAFSGVALIAVGDGQGEGRIGFGVGLVAAAALFEAIGAVLVAGSRAFRPHELLAWYAVVGAAVLWPATALLETGQMEAVRGPNAPLVGAAVVFSAFIASIFGHTAYYWLLQRLPVSQVAPSALLTTVLAVFFGIVLLGEPLTLRFLVGGAITLAGVSIILFRSPKAPMIEPGA